MAAAVTDPVVQVQIEHDVGVVLIDHPPINAASTSVRRGLLEALSQLSARPEVSAIVIIGAGTTFIAGADLREFDQPLAEPQLPQVIAAIESCRQPVVAALHGAALGGGFELALGCDARLALAGSALGLPEVTLGIIPGAGGTQRLPRLIGIPAAIAMICSGERIGAQAALSLGLVDRVVTSELRQHAVAWARQLQGRKHPVRALQTPIGDEQAVVRATSDALRRGKSRPAVRAAIDCILAAASEPIDLALAQERSVFIQLRASREARALRYLFFAERDAGKHSAAEAGVIRVLQNIVVIGAGTMGAGIAIAALDAGFEVALLERDGDALQRGVERIHSYYLGRVTAGRLVADEAERRQGRLRAGLDWSLAADADLIIEAVFEDLTIKQQVFRQLDQVARPGAILASNTSYTDLDAIAAVTRRPGDVVGLHFFSPAHVMRLLEIVRGAATSADVLASSLQLARRLRKLPVVSTNAFGFIGNRIYSAYRRQCEFLLEEGALPQQVDAALERFGFAMGPFAVADLSGLDIAWRMRQSLAAIRDPQARYVRIADTLCEAGRLGQKSGAGYYRYEALGAPRQIDPAVASLIEQARSAQGIAPRAIGDEEITRRALLSMINEAMVLLQQGVAQRASDVDVVLVNGYGFPRWEGGPMFWARERGAHDLDRDLDWLAGASGAGFVRADARSFFAAEA